MRGWRREGRGGIEWYKVIGLNLGLGQRFWRDMILVYSFRSV